jgi:hypothetical protein
MRRLSSIPFATWTRALLAPALVFIATARDRNYQTDFWHHLARGREIVTHGSLLNQDIFTYTVPGKSFQDTNWLPQVLYYALFSAGGLDLVQLVNSLTLAAMMGLLVWLCWRECGSVLVAGGVGAFTFLGLWQLLIIRPQTFSLLLFVALYAALELAQARRRWLIVPPVLMALWVNVHGGFPVGLVLVGSYLLAAVLEAALQAGWRLTCDGRVWTIGACLIASIAATLVNPYGWRVYQYVALTSGVATARHIDEWLPPGLDLLIGKVLAVSVAMLLVLFALPGRRPRVRDICLILCFLPFALGSARMIAWWLLVSAPILARMAAANLPAHWLNADDSAQSPFVNAGIFAVVVFALLFSIPIWRQGNPLSGILCPSHRPEQDLERISQELAQRGDGRVFSRFEWSEYLGWSLAPHYKVFMDGRIEIFPDPIWREYSALTRGRADWQELLDHYGVDYLVLDKAGYHAELLPQVLAQPANWDAVSESGDAVLFVRRQALSRSSQAR